MRNPKDTERTIKELLRNTNRDGIEGLISAMENGGYFKSPCSSSHHLACEGGLAEHSLNVLEQLIDFYKAAGHVADIKFVIDSLVITALLHDLGKMGDFGKPNYVENLVRSKTKNKETGEYDLIRSEAKPYTSNTSLVYEEHEIRSAIIASRYIELTELELHAILHHNALYGKLDSAFNSQYDKHPLTMLLHFADLWCSRVTEVD